MDTAAPSILFVNQHYWPDLASTGQHLTDLAEHLAVSGFRVSVLAGRGRYVGGSLDAPSRETRNGVQIHRVALPGFARSTQSQIGRTADYAAFHTWALSRLPRAARRHRLVISLTTPSLLPVTVRMGRALGSVPYAVWAMDLHPDVEGALGLLEGSRPHTQVLSAVSRLGYGGAAFVVALGPFMAREIMRRKGVHPTRIQQIPVWSDGQEVRPISPRDNALRRDLGFGDDDFVVMYSGNAGLAHRFDEILEAADRLRNLSDVHFIFVGGGPRRREIELEARRRRLPRFRYLDYFPRRALARSLSVADVHLLTLRRSVAGLCAPGKLYGIMAAGRPTAMVGPLESDPGQVISTERVGQVVAPGSRGGARLARLLRAYRDDPVRRAEEGKRARAAMLARYDRSVCCGTWTRVLGEHLTGKAREESIAVEQTGPRAYVGDYP